MNSAGWEYELIPNIIMLFDPSRTSVHKLDNICWLSNHNIHIPAVRTIKLTSYNSRWCLGLQ